MAINPLIRPKVASPGLITTSAVISACLLYAAAVAIANWPPPVSFAVLFALLVVAAATLTVPWVHRLHQRTSWNRHASEQWKHFGEMKRSTGITTEVTVLSVDALEPTGSWVTIRWDRFNHVQQAWLEALPESIWPGAVLLIKPDPRQITIGMPWPFGYYLYVTNFLAWAPQSTAKLRKDSSLPTQQPRFPSVDLRQTPK